MVVSVASLTRLANAALRRWFHHFVMAGHSRSKNGVALLAYVPAIHDFLLITRIFSVITREGG
jgi:hypothetical protein